MASLLLVDYLQRSRAQYLLIDAPFAYTAEEAARLGRIPPRRFAKVVMTRVDGELVMVVMPVHYRLAAELLRQSLGAKKVELAEERHFQHRFPRCEVGAMPPFGHLFGLRALLVPEFDEFTEVHCKAGTHREWLRMPFSEFKRLAHLEPVEKGAVLQLRNPGKNHLQRLLGAVKDRQLRLADNASRPLLASS
jgi:Ala-tRNA(Pro) deacylase